MAYGDVMLSAPRIGNWYVLEVLNQGTKWIDLRLYRPSGRPMMRGKYARVTVMRDHEAVREGNSAKDMSAEDKAAIVAWVMERWPID